MTETEFKLRDAEVQLMLAKANIDDETIVRSCINAFICLARSVTFVMQNESGSGTPLAKWYRSRMDLLEKIPLLKFFNDRRVYSIHKGTVTLQKTRLDILGPQFSTEGNEILGPQTATGWLFENIAEYGLSHTALAMWLCYEYMNILEELVQEWLLEKHCA